MKLFFRKNSKAKLCDACNVPEQWHNSVMHASRMQLLARTPAGRPAVAYVATHALQDGETDRHCVPR